MTKVQNEIWKDIPDYEGYYQVSNLGKVRSLNYKKTGKTIIMSGFTTKRGYKRVLLSQNGSSKKHSVHRLVSISFIPNPENKEYVNHIDGNPSNNHVSNLEWCTSSENLIHAYKIGLKSAVGESNGQAILSEEDVIKIRSEKGTDREIAKKYNTAQSHITAIKTGKLWRHVGGVLRTPKVVSERLKPEAVLRIFNSHLRPFEIAKQTGIALGVISAIKRGDRYSHITGGKHEQIATA